MPRHATATSYGQKSGNPKGRGPKAGAANAGAPTKSFKHFLANLRNSAAAQRALQKAAEDSKSPNFRTAWKLLSEYDEEKPAPPKQELGGELIVRVVRDAPKPSVPE